MSEKIVTSPYHLENVLNNISLFLTDNLDDISKIRVVSRCSNCYKKTEDVTWVFQGENTEINHWYYNCNLTKTIEGKVKLEGFDKDQLLIRVERLMPDFFQLKMEYISAVRVEQSLSPYYEKEDYKVHGTYVYKDRNLKWKQRETEKGLVIMLQDFIDFKGLSPHYSQTIYVEFKEE